MNTSLHTKYRPTSLDEMIGQKAIIKSLRKVVKDGRAKVFMFVGPAGTGKTTMARIVANMVADGKATAANLVEIAAAVFTGVEDARRIIERAQLRAIGASPIKVLILDEAHKLSANAWDALLKATEEPPAHVYYVFCTTNPDKIPQTIKTRAVGYTTSALSEDELTEILLNVIEKEGMDVEAEVVEVIVENSQGSARQALVHLEKCHYCESASDARKLLMVAGESKEVVDLCRLLINPRGATWKDIQRCLADLKDTEAESIRIVICNYFANAIASQKSEKMVKHWLNVLDCFRGPYNQSEKHAPLLLSIGEAIGLAG